MFKDISAIFSSLYSNCIISFLLIYKGGIMEYLFFIHNCGEIFIFLRQQLRRWFVIPLAQNGLKYVNLCTCNKCLSIGK